LTPTILDLMGVEKPKEMTGETLITKWMMKPRAGPVGKNWPKRFRPPQWVRPWIYKKI
jgi:arylsulfatase A-like enzyme